MPLTAFVNKIIPFSSVDGPGNRTAVFLQGCPFDCKYCHNPETRNLCVSCGECVKNCPVGALVLEEGKVRFLPEKCVQCDTCIHTCTHGASPRILELTPEETVKKILKQVPYIRGVTFSGGECTTYPEYLLECSKLLAEKKLPVLLDSNGGYDFSKDPELTEAISGVMLDVKAWTSKDHEAVVGCSNELVLKNLKFLAERGKLFEVRTVVVPGLFDAEETIRETAKVLKPYQQISPIRYKIIAYRPMGVREEYRTFPVPGQEELARLGKIAEAEGIPEVVLI